MVLPLTFLAFLASLAAAQAPAIRSENGQRAIVPWQRAPKSLPAASAASRTFWAAFSGTPDAALRDGLAALGGELLGFAGESDGARLYKVRLAGDRARALAWLRGRPGFLNLLPIEAQDKVASRWFRAPARGLAKSAGARAEAAERATVHFHRPLAWEAVQALLAEAVDSLIYDPDRSLAHVVAAPSRLRDLAAFDEVWRVGPFLQRHPTNDKGRVLTRVAELQNPGLDTVSFPPGPEWNAGASFTGEGILLCVNEGIDTSHRDFRVARPEGGSALRRGPADSWTSSFHGTHVAGIAAGNGWSSETAGGRRYQYRGVAPKATLIPYWESGDVNNHSFTNGFEAYYNYADAGVDERLSNHNGILLDANNVAAWAAANNGGNAPQYGTQRGYYSLLINAKNPIKVAAAGADGRRASFSSMGPTRDGRIGPDVTAPGENVRAAWEGTQDYAVMSGTSMACPQVTGIVALLLQKYQDEVLRPRGLDIHNEPPWNSTLKAILIHTARDMVDLEGAGASEPSLEFAAAGHPGIAPLYGPGPDFATGYGMVDAVRAADYMDPARFLEASAGAGETRSYAMEVGVEQASLRVTLAWDDPPFQGINDSSGALARKLVNDLDLRLVSPSGRVHLPWVLDHQALHDGFIPADGVDPISPDDIRGNPARRGRDGVNNVEVVDVDNPEPGAWTIEVIGTGIAVDQSLDAGINQDFSLVSDYSPEVPQAAPAPDLRIADIAWSPAQPSPNDRLRFRATIRNDGAEATPADVPLTVDFLVSGAVVARGAHAGSLEPGESVTLSGDVGVDGGDGSWSAFSGLAAISAMVDSSDRVGESKETNNARLEVLEVPRFPRPWEMHDIGAVSMPGFGYFYDNTFYVTGEGGGISGAADAGNLVHRPLRGDGEIVARVNWLDNTHPAAKAGVMIREGLDAGARNVFLAATPEEGIAFQHRAVPGGATAASAAPGFPPTWLRLARAGNVFTAHASADGESWTALGTVTVPMGMEVVAGLAVTSRNPGASTTGSFGEVRVVESAPVRISGRVVDRSGAGLAGVEMVLSGSASRTTRTGSDGAYAFADLPAGGGFTVAPTLAGHAFDPAQAVFPRANGELRADFKGAPSSLPAGWSTVDIGDVGRRGSASHAAGVFTLEGAGGDIWAAADHFRYAFLPMAEDGAFTARLTSFAATHGWAKAGVMIREDLGTASRHVFLALTPGNGVAFQRREDAGGLSIHVPGGPAGAPVWLRLTRNGRLFTAWRSADGRAWSKVGEARVSLAGTLRAGLAVTSHEHGAPARATFDRVDLVAAASPFSSGDIGPVGLAGGSEVANGVHTVRGSGADIWGKADAFHFASVALPGDGAIVARVTSLRKTDPWAKAGVMIRDGLAPEARHAFMALTADNGGAFQRRVLPGWESQHTSAGAAAAPYWVRLTRSGDMFRGWRSENGIDWIEVGAERIAMHGELRVGLAVTSHGNSALCEATFDNVSVRHHGGWEGTDVGAVGHQGSFTAAHGTFSVVGSGADIWAEADAFTFVHRPLDGDGAITARVTGLAATHEWAKAGLMIREGTGAGDRHALVSLTGGNGLEFLRRTAAQGPSEATAAAGAAPVWLRLERRGDLFTAYRSADGLTWTAIGSATLAMGRDARIGLAVCSHDNAVTTVGAFSDVDVAD